MPVTTAPSLADPEIAAATFFAHLDRLWASGRPAQLGWERVETGPMHVVIKLPARNGDRVDHYYWRLGAKYYDAAPPTVELVRPQGDGWVHAENPSPWFPKIDPKPEWFGLHSAYSYREGPQRQLVCFSFAAEYYQTDHSPKDSQMWQQGRHTVAATLYRLAEVLGPPHYQGPSAGAT